MQRAGGKIRLRSLWAGLLMGIRGLQVWHHGKLQQGSGGEAIGSWLLRGGKAEA